MARSSDMAKVVGIDLGTTNSLVAYVKDGAPFVIRDKGGDPLLPSIVSVSADDTIYVGREAQRRLLTDPRRTVYSVKRFMGKGIDDVQDVNDGGSPLGPLRPIWIRRPTASCPSKKRRSSSSSTIATSALVVSSVWANARPRITGTRSTEK